jgi:hypothetical protein
VEDGSHHQSWLKFSCRFCSGTLRTEHQACSQPRQRSEFDAERAGRSAICMGKQREGVLTAQSSPHHHCQHPQVQASCGAATETWLIASWESRWSLQQSRTRCARDLHVSSVLLACQKCSMVHHASTLSYAFQPISGLIRWSKSAALTSRGCPGGSMMLHGGSLV